MGALLEKHGRAFAATQLDVDGTGPSDELVAQALADAGPVPDKSPALLELEQRASVFAAAVQRGRKIKPGDLAPLDSAAATAIVRESSQLRELYRLGGLDPSDPVVAALIERQRPPIRGGATGLQASAYMANLPAEGSYHEDGELFAQETERNDLPLEQKAYTGLGGAPMDLRISNVGVLAWARLVFKGTLVSTPGGGSVTPTPQWPWNALGQINLNVQGQTGLISCSGQDLRTRRQRLYRHPKEDVSTAPATDALTGNPSGGTIANGNHSVVLVYDVPIVHDMYTLVGAIFAQSDQIYLNWRVTPGATASLFTLAGGATVSLTGTVHTTITFYDVPFADVQGGRQVLIPNLAWLHGFIAGDAPFNNTGEVKFPLIRTAGQLITYTLTLFNGEAATISPLALDEFRFEYGGNRKPRQYSPVEQLIEKNVQDYNGRLRPDAVCLDFEADNPRRELVYPKGVTELQAVTRIPGAVSLNANARGHFVEETLFTGR